MFLGVQHIKILLIGSPAFEYHYIYLNISHLFRFKQLQQLWIFGSQNIKTSLSFSGLNKTESRMLPLKHVHFYVHVRSKDKFAFYQLCPYLETLDAQFNLELKYGFETLEALKDKPLRSFSGRRYPMQSMQMTSTLTTLDVDDFSHNFNETCEYMDFSYCNLQIVKGNFFSVCPRLKLLDLSHNQLMAEYQDTNYQKTYSSWIALVLFHPLLEVFDISNQIYVYLDSDIINKRYKRSNIFAEKKVNINLILSDSTQGQEYRCNFTEQLINQRIPCEFLPNISSIFPPPKQCMGGSSPIMLPVAPNLHRVDLNSFSFSTDTWGSEKYNKILCLRSNSLKSVDVSRGKFYNSIYFEEI